MVGDDFYEPWEKRWEKQYNKPSKPLFRFFRKPIMINKKNVLGKLCDESVVGQKDAVHVATVLVRAGEPLKPGTKCSMNQMGEAVASNKSNKPIGVVDPYLKKSVRIGQVFQLLLNPTVVENVQHVWDHPTNFLPTQPITHSKFLVEVANKLGLPINTFIDNLEELTNGKIPHYTGSLTKDELQNVMYDIDFYDVWSEWCGTTGFEFENIGTECCPEYGYPTVEFSEKYKI